MGQRSAVRFWSDSSDRGIDNTVLMSVRNQVKLTLPSWTLWSRAASQIAAVVNMQNGISDSLVRQDSNCVGKNSNWKIYHMIFCASRRAKCDMKALLRCFKPYCINPCFRCKTVQFWKYFDLRSLLNYATAENINYPGILKLRVYVFKNR